MGLYRRLRPAPIRIIARQAAEEKKEGEESPDSPDSPGEEAKEKKASSSMETSISAAAATSTNAPASISSSAIPPPSTTPVAQPTTISQRPPPPAPTSQASSSQSTSTKSAAPSSTLTTSIVSRPFQSGRPNQAAAPGQANEKEEPESPKSPKSPESTSGQASSSSSSSSASGQQTSSNQESSATASASNSVTTTSSRSSGPTPPASSLSSSPNSSLQRTESPVRTTVAPPSNTNAINPEPDMAGSGMIEGQQRGFGPKHSSISKGAEAGLVTLAVLGFLVAVGVAVSFFLRRRKRRAEAARGHAEDAFKPDNTGSLHTPQTSHSASTSDVKAHMTQSSANTSSLFGAGHYSRPETVSTNDDTQSRIPPPQPTPNPFADPGRNKAFDQIRGRPRSTTLTDRGSWVQNPFKDPTSDRFDPFGELQEKARAERVRYRQELEREREEQFREKEAMGLGISRR